MLLQNSHEIRAPNTTNFNGTTVSLLKQTKPNRQDRIIVGPSRQRDTQFPSCYAARRTKGAIALVTATVAGPKSAPIIRPVSLKIPVDLQSQASSQSSPVRSWLRWLEAGNWRMRIKVTLEAECPGAAVFLWDGNAVELGSALCCFQDRALGMS